MTVEEKECVKSVQNDHINIEQCMTECNGLMVTSYLKEKQESQFGTSSINNQTSTHPRPYYKEEGFDV